MVGPNGMDTIWGKTKNISLESDFIGNAATTHACNPSTKEVKGEHSCWVWDQPKTKAKHWGLGTAVKPLRIQAWGPEFEHQNHMKKLGVAPDTCNPSPRETETTGSMGLLASQPANLESSRFRWRVAEDIQQWRLPSTCMCSHVHINIYAHKPNKNNNKI